jgi:hypothetical protein
MLLAFEREVANTGLFNGQIADGKEFCHYVEHLDAMCDAIGVPVLSSFCNDAGEVRDEPFPWFDPNDGLRVVRALRKALTLERETVKSQRKRQIAETLIADMDALERDLKSAKRANAGFALFYC